MYTTDVLKKRMIDGAYDAELTKLYPAGTIDAQRKRYCRVIGEFEEFYGEGREAGLFSAPGRTEIGGNHTDHNHGRVLAASVNLDAIAVAAKSEGTVVNVKSEGYAMDTVDISDLKPHEKEFGKSRALVRGVCSEFKRRGYNVGAFDATTASDVLSGSGLSSSAAFEVLLGTIINHLFNDGKVSDVEIAQIAQAAENKFFGKPCGLMDQMASSVGGVVSIDFADTARPVVEKLDVDLHAYGYALCILDSGAGHEGLTDEYRAITDELRAVCRVFGRDVLREVPEADFLTRLPQVRAAAGDRAVNRAFHVYAENRRAKAEKEALEQGDFDRFLALVRESGRSSAMYLQNIIPTGSTAAQELMVTIALCEALLADRGAVRVHGGGFGGTAQAFVPLEQLDSFKEKTEAVLGQGRCHTVMIRPAGGVRLG